MVVVFEYGMMMEIYATRLSGSGVWVEIFFDNIEVGVGSATEVLELVAGEFEVAAGADFLVDARGANFVADGELVLMIGLVAPAFEPDPNILSVMEEFAAMTSRDGPKNCAAEAGFGVDEVVFGHESGAAKRFRGVNGGVGVIEFDGWGNVGLRHIGLRGGGLVSAELSNVIIVIALMVRSVQVVRDFEGVLDVSTGDLGDAGVLNGLRGFVAGGLRLLLSGFGGFLGGSLSELRF